MTIEMKKVKERTLEDVRDEIGRWDFIRHNGTYMLKEITGRGTELRRELSVTKDRARREELEKAEGALRNAFIQTLDDIRSAPAMLRMLSEEETDMILMHMDERVELEERRLKEMQNERNHS